MAQAATQGRTLALLFIDLDHFKRVNDSLGHPVGDVLLQTVAERIIGAVRESDLVARFGGDEFVLLLAGADHPAAVMEVANKLLAAISAPLPVEAALDLGDPVHRRRAVSRTRRHAGRADQTRRHRDVPRQSGGRARCRIFEPAMAQAPGPNWRWKAGSPRPCATASSCWTTSPSWRCSDNR
jgi:GGDEF domain-containing protein